ncbi:MAG: bifunctional precorrin-2 dehydrogenase/sirohydrochlorin ferrochelatase [Synergistaceae bacterium]|nr:bifunctional precorrin-2 dehydrogenase/sirohydrochlorin ferrochelatase [Synergistaceae bacterium]
MDNTLTDNIARHPYFPMMIDLQGKHVFIAGGGRVASRRADTLLRCGALITAVSPVFSPAFPEAARRITRPFLPEDLTADFVLAVAATNSRETNALICSVAHALAIPVNVCDNKTECDFFFPSLISHDYAAVSVCTAGISASLTRRLSDKLRKVWDSWVREAKSPVL